MPKKTTTIKIAETTCKLPKNVNTYNEVKAYGKKHPECKIKTKSFDSPKELDRYLKKK